ncbi:MAG: ergothioneine biosynthesis protein EgtB [Acidobacteriota bacterium]|nr:ergothioneine biosynthesis protein EgtB [Acidobacteriota bacterium]
MPTQASPSDRPVSSSSALLERFRAVRARTLALVAPLSPEDMMVQSCAEASPAKWHLAHTTWFFETFVLSDFLPGYKPFDPDFHWLFNSYYNSLGEMPEKKLRASFSRPPLAEILAYRAYVEAAVDRLLDSPSAQPAHLSAITRIALGLEHEQQHQELLVTDVKHALFTNPLHPAYQTAPAPPADAIAPPTQWLSFNPGLTEIGVRPGAAEPGSAFCFDNETPRHTVFLQPFALASRPVTCAEYLAFMDDNGYARPELWLAEGWSTIREQGWQSPLYWERDPATRSGWRIFTLHGWHPLDTLSETPVCHLSFFEADAFARWNARSTPGTRLPTEFEWEHAAATLRTHIRGTAQQPTLLTSPTPERPDAPAAPGSPANLLEAGLLHPTVASPAPGLQAVFGDVWEWTSSGYTGYPGYRPLPGALGEYNGKFMSSQVVLRGGSCVTPTTHIRATYRNFFTPGIRWQFSGLRLARDL